MVETRMTDRFRNRDRSLFFRALILAIPLTVILGVFLAITGYPVEEWPFVAGVFVVALALSSTFVSLLLLVIGKRLIDYGRLALAERGVDVDAEEPEIEVPKVPLVALTVISVLLLMGTVWGLAISALVFVLERMAMPPLVAGLPSAGQIMLLVGACGLALGMSFHFALFYSLRRMEKQRSLVSAITRYVFGAARGGESSSLLWRMVGFPIRSGAG